MDIKGIMLRALVFVICVIPLCIYVYLHIMLLGVLMT